MVSPMSLLLGQMSRRYTGVAVAVRAERFPGQVDVDRAGDGVGHHQRRRGEVFAFTSGCTRPSKLRLPDSTEATTSSFRRCPSTPAGSGPELPMQVVQP